MVEHYHEFCGAVQLHGAGAQGDHGVDERQVFVLQLLHVAHNVRLRLVPGRANTKQLTNHLKTSSQARIAKYAKICHILLLNIKNIILKEFSENYQNKVIF